MYIAKVTNIVSEFAVVAGHQTQVRQSFDMIGVIQIGIIRNELINQMIEYALENMDDTQK